MHALVQDTHGPTRSVNAGEVVTSPTRLARIAGLFYLFVAIFGGVPAFAGWKLFRYGMSFNRPRDHGPAKADREKEE